MLPITNTPASSVGYGIVKGGTSCPVFSSRPWLVSALGEPTSNFAASAFFNSIGPGSANSLNLDTSALCSIEGHAGAGYTGGRSV